MSYKQILKRLQAIPSTRAQAELAALRENRQLSIADAQKRQSTLTEWYLTIFGKLGINADWLK